jgi:hypothetical protein
MSSRSIASARQKRAGDPPPIANQQMGVPTQQRMPPHQMQQQQRMPPQQQRMPAQQMQSQQQRMPPQQQRMPAQQMPQQQMPQQQQGAPPQKQHGLYPASGSKITISDAIGLITIRLGKLEQFIQQIQEENDGTDSSMPSMMPLQKMDPMDKTMLNNIMSRLDSIEKREPIVVQDNFKIDSNKIIKMEQELRDAKDLLMLHMMKYEKFVLETQDKLNDIINTNTYDENYNDPELMTHYISDTNNINMEVYDENVNENENISAQIQIENIVEQVLEKTDKPEDNKYNKKSKKNNVNLKDIPVSEVNSAL